MEEVMYLIEPMRTQSTSPDSKKKKKNSERPDHQDIWDMLDATGNQRGTAVILSQSAAEIREELTVNLWEN